MTTATDLPPVTATAPGLSVAALARRIGVAPATLRSWHRRYGLGPSGHTDGQRRSYLPQDVARLELMQNALINGATPAAAARYALNVAAPDPHRQPQARDGRRPVGGADPAPTAAGLSRAVLAMDPIAIRTLLADAIHAYGVITTWDQIARPVLNAIAGRWARTGAGVEIEHLLSACLTRVLDDAATVVAVPRNPRPVMLACVADETHTLPLSALAAALAEHGIASHLLGAALPATALHAAVRRTAPSAVLLWAQAPTAQLHDLLTHVPRIRPGCRWFVGGPGWSGEPLPATITYPQGLEEATHTIAASALAAEPTAPRTR